MNTSLSPVAQAVLDAAGLPCTFRECIAAALRDAVDQVVPEENIDESDYDCLHAKWVAQGRQEVRYEILAIAAELASTQPSSENV